MPISFLPSSHRHLSTPTTMFFIPPYCTTFRTSRLSHLLPFFWVRVLFWISSRQIGGSISILNFFPPYCDPSWVGESISIYNFFFPPYLFRSWLSRTPATATADRAIIIPPFPSTMAAANSTFSVLPHSRLNHLLPPSKIECTHRWSIPLRSCRELIFLRFHPYLWCIMDMKWYWGRVSAAGRKPPRMRMHLQSLDVIS